MTYILNQEIMKRISYLIAFLFISTFLTGQVSGGFFQGSDYWGNTFIYFKGTNTTPYHTQVVIRAVNESLMQEKSWAYSLFSGSSFTIGPSDGWIWQPNERLIISYPNGSSNYWVYKPGQNHDNEGAYGDIATPDHNANDRIRNTKRTKAQIDLQISKVERNLSEAKESYKNCTSMSLKPGYYRIIKNYEKMLEELRMEKAYAK